VNKLKEVKAKMSKGRLIAGIVMIVVGFVPFLNMAYEWFLKNDPDRAPGAPYNFIKSLTPDLNPAMRIILGLVGMVLICWGAYLVIHEIFP
jgi:hypothetical protein